MLHVLAVILLPEPTENKERFPGVTITCALIGSLPVVLEEPKDRIYCTPDRTHYHIRSPSLAASFQAVLTRCEFCPVP